MCTFCLCCSGWYYWWWNNFKCSNYRRITKASKLKKKNSFHQLNKLAEAILNSRKGLISSLRPKILALVTIMATTDNRFSQTLCPSRNTYWKIFASKTFNVRKEVNLSFCSAVLILFQMANHVWNHPIMHCKSLNMNYTSHMAKDSVSCHAQMLLRPS